MTDKTAKDTLKTEVEAGIARLRGVRDEMKLQVHLGGMEAKQKLEKLETGLTDLEGMLKNAADASLGAARQAIHDVEHAIGKATKGASEA